MEVTIKGYINTVEGDRRLVDVKVTNSDYYYAPASVRNSGPRGLVMYRIGLAAFRDIQNATNKVKDARESEVEARRREEEAMKYVNEHGEIMYFNPADEVEDAYPL